MVTPFLPGDSLLFATGALAALGKLSLPLLVGCYVVAATLGDAVNYASERTSEGIGMRCCRASCRSDAAQRAQHARLPCLPPLR